MHDSSDGDQSWSSKPLISVVIPAFNAEGTLDRTLASVVRQTYDRLEIIIIDDGSTDDTRGVARAWELQDERVRVLSQANAGLSSARNSGLSHACGRWVAFLDSDDWMDENCLATSLEAALTTGAKTVVYGFHVDFEDEKGQLQVTEKRLPSAEACRVSELGWKDVDTRFLGVIGYAWNKLYEIQPDSDERFVFENGLSLIEDMEFQSRVMPSAHDVLLLPQALVHYVQPTGRVTLGRRPHPHHLELRMRWISCAQQLVRRWGLYVSAQDDFWARMHLRELRYMLASAWRREGSVSQRLRRVRCAFQVPEFLEIASVGAGSSMPWRLRIVASLLAFAARASGSRSEPHSIHRHGREDRDRG